MNSSRFLHELTQDTNYVYNVRESDCEIYQLAQQSLIAVSILKSGDKVSQNCGQASMGEVSSL